LVFGKLLLRFSLFMDYQLANEAEDPQLVIYIELLHKKQFKKVLGWVI
jgi:hypothetical protein